MRTIVHLSDLHFGRIDLKIADILAAKLHELRPSLVIISGDLTQRARARQFRAAADYLRRLPQPQLVVPGNHDVPLYNLPRRLFTPTGLYRRLVCDNPAPRFVDEALLVVGVDTTRAFSPRFGGFWKDGRISGKQLDGLRQQFQTATPDQMRIVVTHHPFIPVPGGDPKDLIHGAAAALPVLAELKVDLLLAGHLHRGYGGDVREIHGGVNRSMLSIQAGTATSTRLRGAPNSFNLFQVESQRIALRVHHWNGVTFAGDEPQRFQRTADGWHAA